MVNNNQEEDNKIVLFSSKKSEKTDIGIADKSSGNEKESVNKVNTQQGLKETEDKTIVFSAKKAEENKVTDIEDKSNKDDLETKKPETEEKPRETVFKVNSQESPITETKDKVKETEPLSEDAVLKFLQAKGVSVESINDLSKKEVLSEEVLEFKKFNEKTGRGINAFVGSKKDWAQSDKDDTIREFFKYSEEGLTDEDIENELELLKLTEDEREDLSEREVKQADQKYRKIYAKALSFMKDVSKEYSIPKEEKKIGQKALSQDEINKAYQPYWDKRDLSLRNLKDISINVEGLGEIKLPISQAQKDMISEATQTQEDYFKRWIESDGSINTDKSSIDMAYAIPEIREALQTELINQVYNLLKEQESKTRRNVTLDNSRETARSGTDKGVITFNSKEEQSGSRMGIPLIPPRK